MLQRVVRIGRATLVSAFALSVGSCSSGLSTIAPVGFTPASRSTVDAWVASLRPARPRLYEIRPWWYRTEQGAAAGGRASIRVVPPDSLRFDYRGPFGQSGNAAIVGDSALWVNAGDDFAGLVTFAPLLWTALGLPQAPPDSAAVFSLVGDDFLAWRYILAGDTLDFVLGGDPPRSLLAEMRRRGQILGQVMVELDTLTGLATQAQIDFWNVTRFELTVRSVDTLANFDATIWKRP